MTANEIFVSVDVETSGPAPGEFSLLSIGACEVYNDSNDFLCELQPISDNADPKALEITGFSLDVLKRSGMSPKQAMLQFGEWLQAMKKDDEQLVFVGFNTPFDWSFINYYFHRFTGNNPFGFSALDIKAYYMGLTNCAWRDTKSSSMAAKLHPKRDGDHNALHDAKYQAELFRLMRQSTEGQSQKVQ